MDTEATEHDAGWIPCRRCKGTGTYSWEAGKSGPCFLCEGTGDGRIQNRTGFGPRRGRRYGNGTAATHESHESHESAGNGAAAVPTVPTPTASHLTAAEHLAAALAGLTQAAPIDADTVRQILASELSDATAKLERLIESAVSTRAMLTEAIAGIPRRMVIEYRDHMGELPAMRHPLVDELIAYVGQNIPVYIVGPAGSGKTTAAHQTAEALGLSFYMQGAMCGSHEILGFVDAHGRYQTTPWRQAFEHGGVMLLDEIDASDPAALLAANAGISNGHMSFPDSATPIARHADFRLIAAANTFGNGADRQYVGRSQLDGATLDRFAFIDWHYDETLERNLACDAEWTKFVQSVRKAVAKNNIRHIVSPRASIMGGKMLAAGMARERVESAFIWKGMSDADQVRVRGAL